MTESDELVVRLTDARRIAEHVITDMADDDLRIKAFEVAFELAATGIPNPLDSGPKREAKPREVAAKKSSSRVQGNARSGRKGSTVLLAEMLEEGYFNEEHTMRDVVAYLNKELARKFRHNEISARLASMTQRKKLVRREIPQPKGRPIYAFRKATE